MKIAKRFMTLALATALGVGCATVGVSAAGCIWCITIIGIPVGLQCFKFATLAFWPFGKEIVYGNGMFSFLVNLIWIVFFGWEMALGNLIVGCIWCITIVGIPFGKQFFKMARLSFMPFGASVIG